jgi:uncharacterized protein YbaR (Trm112 family)
MSEPAMDPDLLDVLRCPAALKAATVEGGEDPGRLELVHGCWLVCEESGYKYPIRDGIPVMLIEEAERWRDTAVEDLPVPPPPEPS